MPRTLQEIFGANSVQDIDTITIAKSDLSANADLNAADQNDGESVFVALLLQASELGLTTVARDGNEVTDGDISQQVAISDPATTFVTRQGEDGEDIWFKRDTLVIDLDFPLPQAINPNNY